MRILLVDDDKDFADSLARLLQETYIVDVVSCGRDGSYFAHTISYDLVIVDLCLPDVDGVEVCRVIRQTNNRVPILVLTWQNEEYLKVYSLDTGADDYLTKPFSPAELLAHVRALTRRSYSDHKPTEVRCGRLILNSSRREVICAGKELRLRKKEFDILQSLLRYKGTVVPKEKLLSDVWVCDSDVSPNTLDVHLSHLREKLKDALKRDPIKTVYGHGYKIEENPKTRIIKGDD